MSVPSYQMRGNNRALTNDNYTDRTINTNSSSFLESYPYVRPPPPAPSPQPSPQPAPKPSPQPAPQPAPAEEIHRFYFTNLRVRSPNNIESNLDFPGFINSDITNNGGYDYIVYLDNYFMYPPSHYLNKPELTYNRISSLTQLDSNQNDKGFLFILSRVTKVPYYITNNFNHRELYEENNKFTITKRRSLISYYIPDPTSTVNFSFQGDNHDNDIKITSLDYIDVYRNEHDFTLFYNFRIYNTNLRVVKETELVPYASDSTLISRNENVDSTGDRNSFKTENFADRRTVFYDNFSEITSRPDPSFDTNPTRITVDKVTNLFIYDDLNRAFYLSVTRDFSDTNEVYITKKINPSLPPDGNTIISSKIYFKMMTPINATTLRFVDTITGHDVIFNKLIPRFSEGTFGSFKNANPSATIPKPNPAAVGPRAPVAVILPPIAVPRAPVAAGPSRTLYITGLTIKGIPSVSSFNAEFSIIVPGVVGTYYKDPPKGTPRRADCRGIPVNECYNMIPPLNGNNKIKQNYTVTTAYNNGRRNKLEPGEPLREGWADVLNGKTDSGGPANPNNAQPIRDQRAFLATTHTANLTTMTGLTTGISISNFDDKRVYYLPASGVPRSDYKLSGTDFLRNLYVKHDDNTYYKLTPYVPTTLYKFKWFWKISNNKSPIPNVMYVALYTSSISFVKSDTPNIAGNTGSVTVPFVLSTS